jgi:hypothetical protein
MMKTVTVLKNQSVVSAACPNAVVSVFDFVDTSPGLF